jgi:hypothetical protein
MIANADYEVSLVMSVVYRMQPVPLAKVLHVINISLIGLHCHVLSLNTFPNVAHNLD